MTFPSCERGIGERPKKRPRLEGEDTPVGDSASSCSLHLDGLIDDCLLHILSYLPPTDLNSIAICGRRYQSAQFHSSLDSSSQKSVTIVVPCGSTLWSFFSAIDRWSRVIEGNHVRILKLERLHRGEGSREKLAREACCCRVSQVESLELMVSEDCAISEIRYHDFWPLYHVFSGIKALDCSSLKKLRKSHVEHVVADFSKYCRDLERIAWNGIKVKLDPRGSLFEKRVVHFRASATITDLCLNDCHFNPPSFLLNESEKAAFYMFHNCETLERLSIKNATYQPYWYSFEHPSRCHIIRPLSQDMLIKLVRHHPTLRWLCSDLTKENVAMLQRERPDIVFAS